MFRSITSRWFLIPVFLAGFLALASPAWAQHGGFGVGHGFGGHGYYGGHGGYYAGHGYYSPHYYSGHWYSPGGHTYAWPYGYSYAYSAPAVTYSYPATSYYAWAPSGGGCR